MQCKLNVLTIAFAQIRNLLSTPKGNNFGKSRLFFNQIENDILLKTQLCSVQYINKCHYNKGSNLLGLHINMVSTLSNES